MTTPPSPLSEYDDLTQLAAVVKSARDNSGLSIRRLATRAGIHHASLARIELGEQRPSPETLQRLAQTLELDETDLFALAGYRLPEGLPSFPAYLRAKYRLPDSATTQLHEYFRYLTDKYNIDPEPDTAPRKQDQPTHPPKMPPTSPPRR